MVLWGVREGEFWGTPGRVVLYQNKRIWNKNRLPEEFWDLKGGVRT